MPEKLLGRVQRTRLNRNDERVFGWIRADGSKKEYFFHRAYVADGRMPVDGTLVRFFPVPQTVEGENDRAVEVEIVSEPVHVPAPEIDSSRHP